jgi:hypothetical protein
LTRFSPLVVALGLIVFSGLAHGYLTDRWQPREEIAASTAKLQRISLTLPDWEGERLKPKDPSELGEVAGYFYARYVNTRDGRSVAVFLVSGRPGPVSIHTPDVCYKANGFDAGEPVPVSVPRNVGRPDDRFMTAQLVRTRSAERLRLRIYWGWSTDGTWQAPDNPRWTFAHSGVLYKLYLIQDLSGLDESSVDDPCKGLMQQLLPELDRVLFAS